jgi:hypothetical protein
MEKRQFSVVFFVNKTKVKIRSEMEKLGERMGGSV